MTRRRRRSDRSGRAPLFSPGCPVVAVGTNYGISPRGVSLAIGISLAEGREILQAHAAAYPVFWSWIRQSVDNAMLVSCMTAPLGWRMRIVGEPNPRAIQNWTMQTIGAEMLRAAVVIMVRTGLTLCATAHDAIMIQSPIDQLEADVVVARNIMERVSLSFTRGLLVRTDVRILRPGERYLEPRGARMWWGGEAQAGRCRGCLICPPTPAASWPVFSGCWAAPFRASVTPPPSLSPPTPIPPTPNAATNQTDIAIKQATCGAMPDPQTPHKRPMR